ncbi:AAA family ATPase [Psychroflexus halocasei]|uniref:Nicotinamide-nucleotide adenylyltransferase, NadR type n=1 Tax=Psychroflexus halocasei TaxID=908615 RepID=A0A1H4CKH1_9FLAO|nr:ATP-binding protein [Psychroflexus halocasei]SEA60828.1 nicotinamide-nucleotide adenylyltransferase, NadR type [Psychroflexus halocasei]
MEKRTEQTQRDIVRIVLFGPESTGKTSLAKALAKHYKTKWVPEFARDYLQNKYDESGLICETKDITPIAEGQLKIENKVAKDVNNLLFCDTNALQTLVYTEAYYDNYENERLNQLVRDLNYDYYFLTYYDTPWEDDDLRDKPNEREAMFNRFHQKLILHNQPFSILKGDEAVRLKQATQIIDQLF